MESLLPRMAGTETFAKRPLGISFLESSYDRSGGNQDWATYQPGSAETHTVFEAEGPGYISRFWIASFKAERWLFYFDDETEPRLDLAKDDIFGGKFPFVSPLAGKSGGGRYCLLPIPFSKNIRIEMVPSEKLKPTSRNYFHINWTRLNLPPDKVQSFPKELSATQSNRVVEVNSALSSISDEHRAVAETCLQNSTPQAIPPGDSLEFWKDSGEGLLDKFAVKINSPEEARALTEELLRRLRLKMFWNGSSSPSVDVPLGDFFCNPFYFRSFSSLPLARVDGAYVCRFPMPYQSGARCVLENRSDIPVKISIGAQGNRESSQGLERLFHAGWRASITSGVPFRMLRADGPGHYIGCFLSAIGQDGSWTILEGDEFLKPDPKKQPPQLGTGLEDYFNGAYYYTSLFDLPLHGLIEKGAMRTDQYRFHLLDAVAFEDSFESGIEFGDRNRARGYMSSVAYWYAEKPAPKPLPMGQERLLNRPRDRFELHGLMAQLFLLERERLWGDAATRTRFFAERYADQPWVDLLKVRALAYEERATDFAAVKSKYEILAESPFAPAAQAARDRLWLSVDPSHALLGIHALGKYRLWQDGELVAEGEGKNKLRVLRIPFSEGQHHWQAELEPTHQGSFFSLCLRMQKGDITSAGKWEVVDAHALPGKTPSAVFEGQDVLPNMTIWAFNPNGYVGMQSPAAGIRLWAFWAAQPDVTKVTLRKAWDSLGPASGLSSEQGRSEEELKAHAIN